MCVTKTETETQTESLSESTVTTFLSPDDTLKTTLNTEMLKNQTTRLQAQD